VSRALIFDCDGVLVDLEIDRHRCAFNQVWRELGIDWEWTAEDYSGSLSVSGGRERLFRLRNVPAFRAVFNIPHDLARWDQIVAAWHRRKTEIFVEAIRGGVVARSGVRRIAGSALAAGWRVGIASSGARDSVLAAAGAALGTELCGQMQIVTGEDVKRKKPAPDVFLAIAKALRVAPNECIVIEDNRNGLLAAVAAGMACVITPTKLSRNDNFTEAALVVSELGDTGGPAGAVLGGRVSAIATPYLDLTHLAMLIDECSTVARPSLAARSTGFRETTRRDET
jgi:HAD superfamily hydrolase (TIGR01509 family)